MNSNNIIDAVIDDSMRVRFFFAGVSNAGTTSLFHYLGQHPQIYACPIKEPSYFAASDFLSLPLPGAKAAIRKRVDSLERWSSGELAELPKDGFAFDWSSYQALFEGVTDEIAVGEGSTTYWYSPCAARAISERFPEARFILILRDPADRLFSQYLTTLWHRPMSTCRDFFERARKKQDEWGLVLDTGKYATNLKRFLESIPLNRFSIHLYEDYCEDPGAVCRAIFRFLGVDENFDVDFSRRLHQTTIPRAPFFHVLRKSIFGSLAFSRFVPGVLLRPLQHIYRQPRSKEALDAEDRKYIIEYYRDEIVDLSGLIDRDLTPWLS